ncbi:CoA-binding protein [Bacteroidota bacterium]
MKTVVIGASPNPIRYSNKAMKILVENNGEVIPIGNKKGQVHNINIINNKPDLRDIHTVLLYLGPERQKEYYNYILKIKPKRIIFNPGTYNSEFAKLLKNNHIHVIHNCALNMIYYGQYFEEN